MKNIVKFLICVSIPLIVGGVAGYATSSNISNWYVYLEKPWFNPPNSVFGPVWTVLYVLMGISLFLVMNAQAGSRKLWSIKIFFVQLSLNFAWSFIFFTFIKQDGPCWR